MLAFTIVAYRLAWTHSFLELGYLDHDLFGLSIHLRLIQSHLFFDHLSKNERRKFFLVVFKYNVFPERLRNVRLMIVGGGS